MLGGLFGNDKKLLEEEREKTNALNLQVKQLQFRNDLYITTPHSLYLY